MKLGKKMKAQNYAIITLLFLAAIPAYSQRATLGIDLGQTSDKFGGLARSTAVEGDIEGKFAVFARTDEKGAPSIVAGGEAQLPADTSSHATEFAGYIGPEFWFSDHFSAGFHAQIRKAYLPTSEVNNLFFNRYKMVLFEIPLVLEYRSSSAEKHVFVQAQITPEFSPRLQATSDNMSSPRPNLDHGYMIRGSAGYTFGRWYVKANYETRYFKFLNNTGNPNGLYNWRKDLVTGGVGFVF
jgi:hypothetical protein